MVNNKILEKVGGQEKTKKDKDTSPWSELLPELSSLIIPRLNCITSHAAFYVTCKSWKSITDPPLSPYPYLVFKRKNTSLLKFYKPISDSCHQEDIPELKNAIIRFSKGDWFLMSTRLNSLFLFNPITKARREIPDTPPLEYEDGVEKMCFSSTPTSLDCVVLVFNSCRYCCMKVLMHKVGEKDWKFLVYDEGGFDFFLAICSPVVSNGLVYCLGKMGNLGIFDPSNLSWSIRVKPSQKLNNSERQYLVEFEGKLFSVFLRRDGREVDVLQLNLEDLRWKYVENLGDTKLFVSRYSSFGINSIVRGGGNKVYLPMFNDRGDGLFYSLTTKKFHNTKNSFSKSDYYGVKELKHALWVNIYST